MSYPDPYLQGFMQAMASEKKGTWVRHLFVDINEGNLSDAIAFSHISYVFSKLNSADDEQERNYVMTKSKIERRDGLEWLALPQSEWWQVCRINKNTIKAVLNRLADRGFIHTKRVQSAIDGKTRTIVRPDYEGISEALRTKETPELPGSDSNPLDRIDLTLGSNRSNPLDRIDLTLGSNRSNPPYIQKDLRKEDLRKDLKDPERVREEVEVRIESETDPISERTQKPEPSVTVLSSQGSDRTIDSSQKLIGEDKFSAAAPDFGNAGYEAGTGDRSAGVMRRSEVGSPVLRCEDSDLPGYEAFEYLYRAGLARLQVQYGDVGLAKAAWRKAWQGFHPPEWFWSGLNLYLEQRKESFISKAGNSYACSGHKLLADGASRIRDAIAIDEAHSEALALGLDIRNPVAIERTNAEINRKKNGLDWREYRRQKGLEESQGVA